MCQHLVVYFSDSSQLRNESRPQAQAWPGQAAVGVDQHGLQRPGTNGQARRGSVEASAQRDERKRGDDGPSPTKSVGPLFLSLLSFFLSALFVSPPICSAGLFHHQHLPSSPCSFAPDRILPSRLTLYSPLSSQPPVIARLSRWQCQECHSGTTLTRHGTSHTRTKGQCGSLNQGWHRLHSGWACLRHLSVP